MTSTFLRSSCCFQGWRRWTATKRSWRFQSISAVGSMWRMGAANHDTWLWGIDLLMYFVWFCDESCKSMRVAKPTKMPDRVPSLHADATTHFAEVKLRQITFFPFTPFSGSQPVGTPSHKKTWKNWKKTFLSKPLWAKNPPPARANATASVEFFDFFTLFTPAPQLRLQSLEPQNPKISEKIPSPGSNA